ncbi:MAG: tRNA (adenosine(37)-N6)-dimethylallyltransferase MiaA [Bacteroidia bacterium]
MSTSKKYLINIVGPTAVGKTALAIKLAKHFHTEILSSDSRQFYRELSIGTAKPSPDELQEVPHHFINSLSVTDLYSASDFERDALALLQTLYSKYDVVVMVGGSGLYIKALLEGLDPAAGRDESLRKELKELHEQQGIEVLQERLKAADPTAYETVALQNPQRVMRAIEMAELSLIVVKKETTKRPFIPLSIGLDLPREQLYERINQRVDQMMLQGLTDEVKSMSAYRQTYALQTVGYKELFSFLDGSIPLQQAVSLIKQHTRNYAKRQLTWFRRDKSICWFSPEQENEIIQQINNRIDGEVN